MSLFSEMRRIVVRITSTVVLAMVAVSALAQGAPTEEQLRIFQNLPPEQQQAILQQMGGQGGAGVSSDAAAGASRSAAAPSVPRARAEPPPRLTLAPDDVVIVELALPGTMARRTEPNVVRAARDGAVPAPMPGMADGSAPRRIRPEPETPLDAEARQRLQDIVELVQSRNPYRLDAGGNLNLPGFPPILLAGLNDQQAVQRLAVEPSLLQLDVSLQRLPVLKTGTASLKPYGYELFDATSPGFAPGAGLPVPADHIVGVGDEFQIQLFGSQNRNHRLVVTREGSISFPELGPIRVAGLRFSDARAAIEGRVTQQMIGVQANVTMGDIRSLGVFVTGEVRQIGSHTVSGFATITWALYAAGGITEIGSLRDVQLRRQGQVIRRLDLYDLLLQGNNANDLQLQAGDVVFVPPVGPTVTVEGEVRRPAIYELRGSVTAAELLQMAGGFTTEADPSRASLTRVDEQYRRVVLDIDFASAGAALPLRNGDALQVARLRPQLDSGVVLEGFVHRPGRVAWRPDLRLSHVIGSIDELRPNADPHYVLIRRESGGDRRVQALSADLVAALGQPGGDADVVLQPRDQIMVFDLAPGRERIIKPLLDELRLQAGLARPTEVVRVGGRIKVPGEYPLELGMNVSDLIRAGGSLDAAAYGGYAELARYEVDGAGTRQTELIEVDLSAVLRGDKLQDIALRPFDYLLIKETPEWSEQESMTLRGEVRFPGTYPIRRGETLYDVLQRAGGLTSRAFVQGSAFTREYLRENEQRQKERLSERLQSDLASLALQAAAANQGGASQALASSQSLLSQLQASEAVGRMVIDLPGLLAEGKGSTKDISLRDGDLLVVPQARQEVTVIGEVQSATSHLFSASLSREDYIALSGGTTRKADKKHIHVVRADGSVVVSRGSMLRRDYNLSIQPGDTIVVPLDTERLPRLPFWQAVTQIIYNLAVSVAAVNSF